MQPPLPPPPPPPPGPLVHPQAVRQLSRPGGRFSLLRRSRPSPSGEHHSLPAPLASSTLSARLAFLRAAEQSLRDERTALYQYLKQRTPAPVRQSFYRMFDMRPAEKRKKRRVRLSRLAATVAAADVAARCS